jgi:hypothetical protein
MVCEGFDFDPLNSSQVTINSFRKERHLYPTFFQLDRDKAEEPTRGKTGRRLNWTSENRNTKSVLEQQTIHNKVCFQREAV